MASGQWPVDECHACDKTAVADRRPARMEDHLTVELRTRYSWQSRANALVSPWRLQFHRQVVFLTPSRAHYKRASRIQITTNALVVPTVRWLLSRVAALESSPWRKPWVSRPNIMFQPRRGERGLTVDSRDDSYAPPGLAWLANWTHGSRHGLLSYAAPRLAGSAITKISVNDFFKPVQPSATLCKSKRQLSRTKPLIGGYCRGT